MDVSVPYSGAFSDATVNSRELSPLKCPAVGTLQLFNSKWKPMLLHSLSQAPSRFGELQRLQIPVSHKVLTSQLRELEADGLIARTVSESNVVTVTYSLTPRGESLADVLGYLYRWGQEHL